MSLLGNISINMKENICPMDSNGDIHEIFSNMESMNHLDPEKHSDSDLYSQLVQKETDLELAAQLGKALLEENQELAKKSEQQQEEFSQKYEELTQQKYDLKLRLETVETEYETTVKELQNDIARYQLELEKHKQQSDSSDKTRSQIVHELTQQNERLTEQIKKQKASEEHLETQVQSLRQQVHARRSSTTEHVHQLHILREEINLLTDQKKDLERKLSNYSNERDTISCNFEESQDRILMLEKQTLEQEEKIRQQDREMQRLQEQNSELSSKLDDSLLSDSFLCESNGTSLLNELTGIASSPSTSTPTASPSHSRLQHPSLLSQVHRPSFKALSPYGLPFGVSCMDDEDIECDDLAISLSTSPVVSSADRLTMQTLASFWTPQHEADFKIETMELKQELLEVFRELQGLICELEGRQEEWDPHSVQIESVKPQAVVELVTKLRQLTEDMVNNQQTPDTKKAIEALEHKVEALTYELSQSESQLDKVKNELAAKDLEYQHQSKELDEYANKIKVSLQHDEIKKLQEERDRLQDEAIGLTKDDVIEQTRQERDEAIERKNQLECDLVQARVDLMSLDAQLMDAIQQKLKLSQQLELWQDDMSELIGSTVVNRLQLEKKQVKTSPSPQKRKMKFTFPWS